MAVVLMSNPDSLKTSQEIQRLAQVLEGMTSSMVRAQNPKDINYGNGGEQRIPDVENKGPRA